MAQGAFGLFDWIGCTMLPVHSRFSQRDSTL